MLSIATSGSMPSLKAIFMSLSVLMMLLLSIMMRSPFMPSSSSGS